MPSWNHLPPEIKQLVIKKLDFMGRLAMKSVSHSDRCIVESVVFHLPRVRFGYKEERCLIVIYQGIEKFLRLEFIKQNRLVTVIRSENTSDPKDVSAKTLRSIDPLQSGLEILKELFAHPSISINVLEWDFPEGFQSDSTLLNRVAIHFIRAKLHVKEIASNTTFGLREVANNVCVAEKVKTFRAFGYALSDENLVPTTAIETYEIIDGRHRYNTNYQMENSTRRSCFYMAASLAGLLSIPSIDNLSIVVVAKFLSIYASNPNLRPASRDEEYVSFYGHSTCGTWLIMMASESVEKFSKFKNLKCGLENDCGHCGDAFEFWYYQNLPRRILHEPFWSSWVRSLKCDVEVAIGRYRADEKVKTSLQKGKKIQKSVSSWGFKPVTVETLMELFEGRNRAKKKKKNNWKKKGAGKVEEVQKIEEAEDVEDLEDVEIGAGDCHAPEDKKDSETDVETAMEEDSEYDTAPEQDSEDEVDSEDVEATEDVEDSEEKKNETQPEKCTCFHHTILSKFTIIFSIFLAIIAYSIIFFFYS